jgi:hypothetical protein
MVKDAVLQVMEELYGGDVEPLADGAPEDGLVGKIMSRHGAEVLRALDALERLKAKARALTGRGGAR